MHNTAHGETLALAGYPVFSTTSEDLCEVLQGRLEAYRKTVLVFANTNFVLQCQPMRKWLSGDDVIIVNDGIGMDIASLLQHGKRYRDNLNGTDFMPLLLRTFAQRHKIFLLGGKPGVAEKAGDTIARQTGQRVVGCADGYSSADPGALCARINASGADIVLVAMGNPIQEEWIRQHMGALNARLLVSVGALFDFLSGGAQRAPQWVQKIRFEWLYRLSREPRRLAQRYTLDLARFLFLCVSYPLRRQAATPVPTA
ncbi:MAG: WecB/TagA/CpsF family glycosyltransferase [Rhodoferax sp.]|nr:WecB/TagA/CpsF family glycosyltransferase [Rhodoferax sp.]